MHLHLYINLYNISHNGNITKLCVRYALQQHHVQQIQSILDTGLLTSTNEELNRFSFRSKLT